MNLPDVRKYAYHTHAEFFESLERLCNDLMILFTGDRNVDKRAD